MKSNSLSFIDHVLLSNNLCNDIVSYKILDIANNFSDHLPIELVCNLKILRNKNLSKSDNTNHTFRLC